MGSYARSSTCPADPSSIESFWSKDCISWRLLPNLVLHAIQVYLVPFALDLCKHSRVHGASNPEGRGLEPWRVYHYVAASLHHSPRGGSERLEQIVNALRDSRPIFSNCHFSFHVTMSTLFCRIIFEPSCAGTCFTVVRLVLVAGARRHFCYMAGIAVQSCSELV